jgi:hypothetical protein
MADEGYITEAVTGGIHPYDDNTDFALNGGQYNGNAGQQLDIDGSLKYDGWLGNPYIQELATYLTEKCPACEIQVGGFSSKDGQEEADANTRLSEDRASNVQAFLLSALEIAGHPNLEGIFQPLENTPAVGASTGTVDSIGKKEARYSSVEFVYKESRDRRLDAAEKPIVKDTSLQDLALSVKKRYFNECTYFQKLKQEDSFVYASIEEKVRYFHPAFHSITPEGFNSRLNFLQQCTRQGPTVREGVPTNLAFGTPPVCILRIGDFYHTKIIIDNIALSFDPLVWDLNPEGVGVQPMMCTVDMSFKFIGGSSLQGPINRLQNAVSYNFFANTEIYSDYADSIKISNDPEKPNTIVNGFNPNNFDQPVEDESNADVNASGLGTKNDTPDIAQEDRANEEIEKTPPVEEEAPAGSDEDILKAIKLGTIQIQNDGKVLVKMIGGSGKPLTSLTKEYPAKLKVFVGARRQEIGSATIKIEETTTIISNDSYRNAIISGDNGQTYSFQVAIKPDGDWITVSGSRIGITSSCGDDPIAGDLLTTDEYNQYKDDKANDNCD